jgi:oligosaccharide repeat unit polymerase
MVVSPANGTRDSLTSGSSLLSGLGIRLFALSIYLLLLASYLYSRDVRLIYLSNAIAFFVALANLTETSDLFHPFTLIPCVHGMYSVLPLVSLSDGKAIPDGETLVDVFGAEGGAIIFSAATLGIVLSWGISWLVAPSIRLPPFNSPKVVLQIPRVVPWITLVAGAALVAAFFAKVGFSNFARSEYLERFQARLTPGMGIFTYGITLFNISLSLFLSQAALDFKGLIATGFSFGICFATFGERKYLVIPILMLAAAYQYRGHRLPVLATTVVCATLYLGFEFVGYIRTTEDGGLSPGENTSIADFFAYFVEHIGWGEMASLYGTASAAYINFIEALPRFGDYLQSWQMAVPQLLMTPDYLTANDRFALAYDPLRAYDRMGWGFSFFGEAYMVMGLAGPVIVATVFCFLAACIYNAAWKQRFQGLAGSLWFSLIYYQVWVQRNAFSHFFKDWFVYEALPLVLLALAGKLAGRRPADCSRSGALSHGLTGGELLLRRRRQADF